jgi:hypothetical protein
MRSGTAHVRIWVLPAYAFAAGATAALAPPVAGLATMLPLAGALLWLLPDRPLVSPRLLSGAFAFMVAAQICVPTYYMAQAHGLPWISLRRIVLLAVIALAPLRLATCADARARLVSALGAAPFLLALNIGFDLIAGLSILFSPDPALSIQSFSDAALNWRLPFLACLLVVGDERDGAALVRLIGLLSLCVASLGVADFVAQRNFALDIFPQGLLAAMARDNPGIKTLLEFNPWRNGLFRAVSIYNTPLSFGEFAALCAPLGGFLVLHGARPRERALGIFAIAAALASLFVSGSRGGAVGFLLSMSLLALIWVVRLWRTRPPDSLAGPIAAVAVGMTGVTAVAAIFLWKRLSNIVFGGGDSAGSTASRAEQMALAWPHVFDSPLFGNGFGLGGIVVDWRPSPEAPASIDSYLVSVLVETGFPGALCYFGMIALAAGACLVLYLRDRDPRAALAGPLGCSLIAYEIYRLALSQRENQTLVFILLALVFVCIREAHGRRRAADSAMARRGGVATSG